MYYQAKDTVSNNNTLNFFYGNWIGTTTGVPYLGYSIVRNSDYIVK